MVNQRNVSIRIDSREFKTAAGIDAGISRLQRRVHAVETLDIAAAFGGDDIGPITVVQSDVIATIFEVFGPDSWEFNQYQHLKISPSLYHGNMSLTDTIAAWESGRRNVLAVLNGLICRLNEKKEDLEGGLKLSPATHFDQLNLHPRVGDASRELFFDGHHWEAVFAASKALVNYVKERSGIRNLDGTPLVRRVFSRNNPILAFNDLLDQTDQDEQEGMMHLFEGAILGIRNPGGHSFPEGSEQRAIEYISFLSLLANRVNEARVQNNP